MSECMPARWAIHSGSAIVKVLARGVSCSISATVPICQRSASAISRRCSALPSRDRRADGSQGFARIRAAPALRTESPGSISYYARHSGEAPLIESSARRRPGRQHRPIVDQVLTRRDPAGLLRLAPPAEKPTRDESFPHGAEPAYSLCGTCVASEKLDATGTPLRSVLSTTQYFSALRRRRSARSPWTSWGTVTLVLHRIAASPIG